VHAVESLGELDHRDATAVADGLDNRTHLLHGRIDVESRPRQQRTHIAAPTPQVDPRQHGRLQYGGKLGLLRLVRPKPGDRAQPRDASIAMATPSATIDANDQAVRTPRARTRKSISATTLPAG